MGGTASAPATSRAFTTARCPADAARCSGVLPCAPVPFCTCQRYARSCTPVMTLQNVSHWPCIVSFQSRIAPLDQDRPRGRP